MRGKISESSRPDIAEENIERLGLIDPFFRDRPVHRSHDEWISNTSLYFAFNAAGMPGISLNTAIMIFQLIEHIAAQSPSFLVVHEMLVHHPKSPSLFDFT